jgi:hypothetical protein
MQESGDAGVEPYIRGGKHSLIGSQQSIGFDLTVIPIRSSLSGAQRGRRCMQTECDHLPLAVKVVALRHLIRSLLSGN